MAESTAIEAKGIRAVLEHDCGMLAALEVEDGEGKIAMLHRAPWRGKPDEIPADAPPHLARLAGDFFCAPFADATIDRAPFHGWTANGHWTPIETRREGNRVAARFMLDIQVLGAKVEKVLMLIDDHPFLYQHHIFTGGEGAIPVSNHANLTLPHGARLNFSPKRWFETPAHQQETDPARGRSLFAPAAMAKEATKFPRADGGTLDLTTYPIDEQHEDFVIGVEAEGRDFGWTAVHRPKEGDLYLSLRDPRVLPLTMLWFSHGGRYYPPWSSRHRHVLGVEEGVGITHLGHSARQSPHPLEASATATALKLEPSGSVEVRHVTGCLAWPGDGEIVAIEPEDGALRIIARNGATRQVPFDARLL
jgi:hypothetical protein